MTFPDQNPDQVFHLIIHFDDGWVGKGRGNRAHDKKDYYQYAKADAPQQSQCR